MRFSWDTRKRASNLRKHGLDFADGEAVFGGETLTLFDARGEHDEDRFLTFGEINGRVVCIVHTETEDVIRIISMRKATTREAKVYYERLQGVQD